jgi:hypothetical protein
MNGTLKAIVQMQYNTPGLRNIRRTATFDNVRCYNGTEGDVIKTVYEINDLVNAGLVTFEQREFYIPGGKRWTEPVYHSTITGNEYKQRFINQETQLS